MEDDARSADVGGGPSPGVLEQVEALEGEIVDERERAQKQELYSLIAARSHEGPLPASEDFARYEAVLPGSADRIVQLAERAMTLTEGEAQHRQATETKVVDHNIAHEKRSQRLAAVFAAVGFGAGITFIAVGLSIEGFIALLLPLGIFISRFLDVRSKR